MSDQSQSELSTELTDTVTLSSVSDTAVSWNWTPGTTGLYDSLTTSLTAGSVTGAAYNGPFTINTGAGAPWATTSPTSGKINLSGEGADVEVNGWSLVEAVKRIEDRLGLYQPNPELESEWSELKSLGDQYRALEQHIQEKQATWDRLGAMPAPNVE